jgi:hypothetical protein
MVLALRSVYEYYFNYTIIVVVAGCYVMLNVKSGPAVSSLVASWQAGRADTFMYGTATCGRQSMLRLWYSGRTVLSCLLPETAVCISSPGCVLALRPARAAAPPR